MTEDLVAQQIRELMKDVFGRNIEQITDDADPIIDLGADSMDMTELMMRLEDEFDIYIDEDDSLINITVGQVIEYVKGQIDE